MKKVIVIAGLSIGLFSCGNQPSAETQKLQHESDSVQAYTRIYEKYSAHKIKQLEAGIPTAEVDRYVDSIYKEQYPIKGAEWMK